MQTTPNNLSHLLAAFENHQGLRRNGASIAQLSESRARLDKLRLQVRSKA